MATQIQAYKTSNGILFENKSDALNYETFLVEKNLNFVNLIAEINELLINQNVKHRDTQEILQVTEINSASQFINKCMVDTSFINCSGLTKVIYNRITTIGDKYKAYNCKLPWWTLEDAENDLKFKIFK